MTHAVVIGAGVIGASVAWRLAQSGAAVTVLEAMRVGSGTSAASFAWTNSNDKTPKAYHDLNVAGMRAHAALRDEFASAAWWHGGGNVEWITADAARAAHRAKVERLQSWGYAVEWLSPPQLMELEPDVDLAAVGDASIAYYPEEGWLDPVSYSHAMVKAASRHGAQVRCGARVTDIRVSSGRVTDVRTADGEVLGADVVVNCAGPWADEVAQFAGVTIPLAPRTGLLVITPPVPTCLQRVIHAPQCSIRPDGGGRLMLHADGLDESVSADTPPTPMLPVAREVVRRAARLLPDIAEVAPEAVRIGVRPIPSDGHPAVGSVPGLEGYYEVVTHSGVTLAPFLGQAVADELVHGRREPLLEPFRPGRFWAVR